MRGPESIRSGCLETLQQGKKRIAQLEKQVIDQEFPRYLEKSVAEQAGRAFSSGRKIRPLVRHLIRRSFGIEPSQAILSIEALHKSSLILDNMLDGDQYMSPGQRSLHTLVEPSRAALVANFFSDLAFRLERKEKNRTVFARLELLNDLQMELFEGISSEMSSQPSIEVWEKITSKKSALMRGSFELAAIDTGLDRSQLAEVGGLFTRLLQINDDLGDVLEEGLNIVRIVDGPEMVEGIIRETVSKIRDLAGNLPAISPVLQYYLKETRLKLDRLRKEK